MTGLHDPAFGVRRVLWLAYGVLAVALIFFIAAVVMLRERHLPGVTTQRPPAASSPSASPAPTSNPAAAAPTGGDTARAQPARGDGRLTRTGGTPGEPPGDIEDEPAGGAGSGPSSPPATSGGGTVPPVSVPNPIVPTVPPAVVPAPSIVPSVLPRPLF